MNTRLPALSIVGGLMLFILAVFGFFAIVDALADDGHMMDGAGDMMDGGMMDGGMMGARGPVGRETSGTASGLGDVRIVDFTYEPSTLNVTLGTVVTWTNGDRAPHTATAEDDSFDTGRLGKGESAEISFDSPGSYEYYCIYHPYMEGSVIVASAIR